MKATYHIQSGIACIILFLTQNIEERVSTESFIEILEQRLCDYKEVEIIEANACIDHIYMLAKIPPMLSISQFM